jgi:hypothetical protein
MLLIKSDRLLESKNSTRKKSRNGLRLSAMYSVIGLVASATPPMKAPMA